MTNEPMPLPRNWLAETKKMQEASFGYSFEDMPLADKIQYVKDMVLALEDEAHEVLGEVKWKPWSHAEPYINRREYIKELVDAQHFIANLLVAVDCTDDEFWSTYQAKMDVNKERQAREGGYLSVAGHDKCVECTRSFDDVGKSDAYEGLCLICEKRRISDLGTFND